MMHVCATVLFAMKKRRNTDRVLLISHVVVLTVPTKSLTRTTTNNLIEEENRNKSPNED